MASVRTAGRAATIETTAIETLRGNIRGNVLTPGMPGYDKAREIWNGFIDRNPAVIASCAGAADVIRAVNFGRENGLVTSVKGGGHNIAGNAVCDGGLMIDLSPMKFIHIDPKARIAHVSPGATLADFDREAQAFALATPLGINSTTGVAGLTLGGGFGWLSRRFGLTTDNLLSADIVTAEGKLIHASAKENKDLFWGLRGGGGNFGVVTDFEFQLHPVGPEVYAGLVAFPGSEATSVIEWYREYVETAPEELTAWFVMRKAPPLPFLPASAHGTDIIVIPFCYSGDPSQGAKVADPIRKFGTVLGEHVGPMPFVAWQQVFDPLLARGARNYWKTNNFVEISDGLITALTDAAKNLPSPQCEVFVGHLAGQVNRVAEGATAYPHRNVHFVMNVHARWEKPQDDEGCIGWARKLFNTTTPYATGGAYVNFMTQDEADRLPAAYGADTWKRLVELKNKWDPKNFFCMNQNIKPTV